MRHVAGVSSAVPAAPQTDRRSWRQSSAWVSSNPQPTESGERHSAFPAGPAAVVVGVQVPEPRRVTPLRVVARGPGGPFRPTPRPPCGTIRGSPRRQSPPQLAERSFHTPVGPPSYAGLADGVLPWAVFDFRASSAFVLLVGAGCGSSRGPEPGAPVVPTVVESAGDRHRGVRPQGLAHVRHPPAGGGRRGSGGCRRPVRPRLRVRAERPAGRGPRRAAHVAGAGSRLRRRAGRGLREPPRGSGVRRVARRVRCAVPAGPPQRAGVSGGRRRPRTGGDHPRSGHRAVLRRQHADRRGVRRR